MGIIVLNSKTASRAHNSFVLIRKVAKKILIHIFLYISFLLVIWRCNWKCAGVSNKLYRACLFFLSWLKILSATCLKPEKVDGTWKENRNKVFKPILVWYQTVLKNENNPIFIIQITFKWSIIVLKKTKEVHNFQFFASAIEDIN